MFSRHPQPIISAMILLILSMLACQLPQDVVSTPTSLPITQPAAHTSTATLSSSHVATSSTSTPRPTSPPTAPEHQIGSHLIYGIAGFYDRETSQSFIPRGANYSILIPIFDHYEDRLFGVGVYDRERTEIDFNALKTYGYNTLRILLDGCTSGNGCIGVENGSGLNPAYLDNIVDLMQVAKENGLFLLFASQDLPELGGYRALADQGANRTFTAGRNAAYLTSAGIQAAQQYWADLLTGLIARNAPIEIVLGWELQSEQYYQSDQAPFSLESGRVRPANGKTYDLSDPSQKQAIAGDGMRYYIDQIRQTILTYDPTALVTMGFFAPDAPNPWREGDERLVDTVTLLENSSLDFFDFHANPGMGLSMSELAQNFGLDGHVTQPILMGEAGASTWIYPAVAQAAIAAQDWIAASCAEGFSGWLYNGYNPSPAGLPDATWGMVDEGNAILSALSPLMQPDACTTTVLPGRNLALNKPVLVSAALPDQTPGMAVDGDQNTQWSAGAFPTQWIEIDLGAPSTLGEIRLTVGMWPAGETVHRLWVGASRETMRLVAEFSGQEYDYDVLSFTPATPLPSIRYVRVDTTESPSWVSWREIEVLAPFSTKPTPTSEITPTQ